MKAELQRLYARRSELERKLEDMTCECDASPIVHSLRLNKLAIKDARAADNGDER